MSNLRLVKHRILFFAQSCECCPDRVFHAMKFISEQWWVLTGSGNITGWNYHSGVSVIPLGAVSLRQRTISEFGLNIAKIYSMKLGYASYHVNIDG